MEPFRDYTGRYPYQEEVDVTKFRNDAELIQYTSLPQWIFNDLSGDEFSRFTSIFGDKYITNLGMRLRQAMGAQVLSRNHYRGGEFRVPSYHSYAEGLEGDPWKVVHVDSRRASGTGFFWILPYSHCHEGKRKNFEEKRWLSGFMVNTLCPYEYAYEFWDDDIYKTSEYVPDLYDNVTFATWASTLPQPISLTIVENAVNGYDATLSWSATEPRVHRSNEMGRYTLGDTERSAHFRGYSWRNARAEALVLAWEKMAANEPADRYEEKQLESWRTLDSLEGKL